MECGIARALEETGDWWSMLILRSAFLGASRFQTFQETLGIAPTTLTRRLEQLTAHGLLSRRRYSSHPPREQYELTEKGRDFLPVLVCLGSWGRRWLCPDGAPMEFVDAKTGQLIEPVVVDRRTGRELTAGTVALRAGPGASEHLKRALSTPVVLGGKLEENA
jgi:DNA-binding HxlR family transcriptional regulator